MSSRGTDVVQGAVDHPPNPYLLLTSLTPSQSVLSGVTPTNPRPEWLASIHSSVTRSGVWAMVSLSTMGCAHLRTVVHEVEEGCRSSERCLQVRGRRGGGGAGGCTDQRALSREDEARAAVPTATQDMTIGTPDSGTSLHGYIISIEACIRWYSVSPA